MKGVLLDLGSMDAGDLDLSTLHALCNPLSTYSETLPEQVGARIGDAQVVISNKVLLDADAMAAAAQLKLICVAATGINNVDLEAARARGIAVCNVRGYATASVVEHVFALLLSLVRQLDAYRNRLAAGDWQRAPHFCLLEPPMQELRGRTLGIVGYGELGRAVARVAEAFGMRVLLAQRPGAPAAPDRIALHDLLPQVDIVSLHCPLTEQTRDLIGAPELAAMKPTALLINTARGGLVDEAALLAALQSGRLGGAGIDVLAQEPPLANNALLAARLPNLIVTPHIAWASLAARQRLVEELALNIRSFQSGELRNPVP